VSAVLSCFGVFYGLLLGLLAVAGFQNYSRVDDLVAREALLIGGMYSQLADVVPQALATELKAEIQEYCRITIEQDRPEQRRGQLPRAGTAAVRQLLNTMYSFEPRKESERLRHEMMTASLEKVRDIRRERMYRMRTGLPGTLWYVVLIGAVVNIFFIYLFDLELMNVLLLGGILSFFIATVIGLILVLDQPMRGPRGVQPDACVTVHEFLMAAPAG
jgi:VIT1/CCC1 family predicted Fe2+/Mn2+ transporter